MGSKSIVIIIYSLAMGTAPEEKLWREVDKFSTFCQDILLSKLRFKERLAVVIKYLGFVFFCLFQYLSTFSVILIEPACLLLFLCSSSSFEDEEEGSHSPAKQISVSSGLGPGHLQIKDFYITFTMQ